MPVQGGRCPVLVRLTVESSFAGLYHPYILHSSRGFPATGKRRLKSWASEAERTVSPVIASARALSSRPSPRGPAIYGRSLKAAATPA